MSIDPSPGALALAEASIDRDEGFPVGKDGLAHPYWDDIGRVWTIGTGLTRLNGKPVTASTPPITRAQNDAAVGFELTTTAILIANIICVAIAPCEWAALANWMYNVGGSAAASSTLVKDLNAGNRAAACEQFAAWNKAGGRVIPGLVERRKRTVAMFLGQDVPGVTDQPGMPSAAERCAVPGGASIAPVAAALHAGSSTIARPYATKPVAKPPSPQPGADALMASLNPVTET